MARHISRQFDLELESIREQLLEMGGLVEEQVRSACRALLTRDADLARQVRAEDAAVNAMEIAIDEQCMQTIARRQPTAGDLRLLIAVIKSITDLERIGDEADRIARMAEEQAELDPVSGRQVDIRHLASLVGRMVSAALDAMARSDATAANEVIDSDSAVDAEYRRITEQLMAQMSEEPNLIRRNLNSIWAVRALERIGDHAKNIAEHTVYQIAGRDVRHRRRRA